MRSVLFLPLLMLLPACAMTAVLPPPSATEGRFELVVLGIAQDGGLPHVGCTKECCRAARATGTTLGPASLGILDTETGRAVLVEATPAIESQLARFRRVTGTTEEPRHPVDAVLLTHAHIGHYTGLIHFGREVASTRDLPVHTTARFARFLRKNGPWSQLVELDQVRLASFRTGDTFEPIPGLRVRAIEVPHRDEFSDTVAFRIEGSHRTVLFCPDIDRWTDENLAALLDGVDIAYLDATFYDGRELPGRDLSEIPHPPMVVTMERLAERARATPGALRFIHLNHTNPALRDPAVRAEVRRRGFAVAEEGERLRF